MRHLVAIFLLIGFKSYSANKCVSFYAQSSEVSVNTYVQELAQLQLEIYKMEEAQSKMLAVTELKGKLQLVSREVGYDVRPLVAKKFQTILSKETRNSDSDSERKNRENKKTKMPEKKKVKLRDPIQPDEIENLQVLFNENLGDRFHTFNETYFHDRELSSKGQTDFSGSGVSWTQDERYVVLRNTQGSRIFDTKEKKFIDFKPKRGLFSRSGHLWAETDKNGVMVTDLDTGKIFGPFDGFATQNYFTSDYLITVKESKGSGVIKKSDYTYHSLKSEVAIPLGEFYMMVPERDVVVRKAQDKFEVVSLKTGNVVDSFQGTGKLNHYRVDFFEFQHDGVEYIYRGIDGEIIPFDKWWGTPKFFSPDGTKLITQRFQGPKSMIIVDLKSMSTKSFNDGDGVRLSPDGKSILVSPSSTENWSILVNLETMKEVKLNHRYDRFSPNGEWLYRHGNSNGDHKMYEVATGQENEFNADFYFSVVGTSDLMIVQEKKGSIVSGIFLGNAKTRARCTGSVRS